MKHPAPSTQTFAARRAPARAFTLIEIMVVVVIIVILLGIGAAVGPAVLGSGERHLTSTALANCQMLLDEYITLTGVTPSSTADFFNKIKTVRSLSDKLGAMKSEMILNGSSFKDGWGNELVLNVTGSDGDKAYAPKQTTPYFISVGPDNQAGTTLGDKASGDNMYSFNPGAQ
jgi:prepilin-type N-terminal cleavage/methylation domain-containing protein